MQPSDLVPSIHSKATLHWPAEAAKGSSWTFLTLPRDASARLPSRGMTTVEGTINGSSFRATLEPDGKGSHGFRVSRKMREAAGDVVALEITPVARRDWIQWIVSAKRPETRARRIHNACGMLAAGKRRPCCFDGSGLFSKSLSAPTPA